jgi:nitroreductase
MSTSVSAEQMEQALRTAAARATLAPSIHNTQPWRWVVRRDRLELYSDP